MVGVNPSLHLVVPLERKEGKMLVDKRNNTQKIRMNCLSLLYFWCKQDMVWDIELLLTL